MTRLQELLDAATDVLCVQCGYNLRGLVPTGRCPECGTAIAESFCGTLLRFANPKWLNRLRWGARLLFWVNLAMVVESPMSWLATIGGAWTAVWYVFSVALSVTYLVGVFLFTTQEPRLSLTESTWSWRHLMRRALIVAVVVGLARNAAQLMDTDIGAWATYILSIITYAVVVFSTFAYVRELAVRIPHPRMARSARILKWSLTISFLLCYGLYIAMEVTTPPNVTPATGTRLSGIGTAYALGFGVVAVFWIWSLVVWGRCHKALKAAMAIVRSPLHALDAPPVARPIGGAGVS